MLYALDGSSSHAFTLSGWAASLGKADVAGEEAGKCTLKTVVIGAQAFWEGLPEITSGRTRWQQWLFTPFRHSSSLCSSAFSYAAKGSSGPNRAFSELVVTAWPTSGNVNFQYCNPTAGSRYPNAATLSWRVVQ